MTPSTFLANFRHVVNAPLGVSRLREMVYALAVSGSLCPQRPDDGTGHRLLEQINAEKESRSQKGVFKRSPKLEGAIAKYSDTLPRIPGSWAWSRLVDLGEINPRNDADDDILAAFAPMNAISELHNGPIRSEDRKWGSIKKGFTHFANGDVMVAKITPCFENGKGAVLRGLTNGIGAGTTELHVVRPLPGVLPAYIYVFLRSPHFKTVGESHMTGTAGQKRLSTEYFALREFPLPPLEEQERIVAKVDELMRLCDRLEAQQQEREKLLPLLSRANHTRLVTKPSAASLQAIFHQPGSVKVTDLRQTIRDLAIRGRLVPPGREDAGELLRDLREIRNVATSKKKRGAAALPARVPDELGFQIPQHWRWAQFGELGDWGAGATPNRADKSYYGGKMPWYKSGELNDGVLDTAEEFITEKALNACSLRINEPGDVLVAMYGATIGKVGIASVQCTTNQAVCACTPYEGVFNRYLLILLKAMKPWFIANAAGAAQPNYSKDKIIRTSAPLPPLEEQKRIVAKVDELMRLCDGLESVSSNRKAVSEAFARSAIAAITSTDFTENQRMKPPKTVVVTALKAGEQPQNATLAPLAALLATEISLAPPKTAASADAKRDLTAKELWQLSGLEIDAFYRQLKTEMANGWIEEPHRAFVREQFDIWQKINELKGRLGWEEVTGSIREWWESFEQENRHRPELLLRLLERLALKKLTIASFLKKYTFQTQDIQTVYNDSIWLQKEEIDSLLMDQAESET